MLKRVLWYLIALPAGIVLITMAIANRHHVLLVLDPLNPDKPALSVELPFFSFLLGTLLIGVILGGIGAWFSQAHWRRAARTRLVEAKHWRKEAGRLTQERDANVSARARALLPAGE